MTREEWREFGVALFGEEGPRCPECGDTVIEDVARGYVCWMCGCRFDDAKAAAAEAARKAAA